jgi:Ca2+/H+ antiporter
MPDSYVTQIQEFVNNSVTKIPEFIKYISLIFTRILDKIVNGFMVKETIYSGVNIETSSIKHKYYRYFISILLILILFLFHYLNTRQNLFYIKNTKYEALLEIMLVALSIYFFLFFVYRNNTSWDNPSSTNDSKYNSDVQYANVYKSRSLIERDLIRDKDILNKDVLKKSVSTPLFNMMKYIFYLLLTILIPLFIISYALYSHKVDDTNYNITRVTLIIIIILIMLSIVALIFSIKTPSSSIYCEIKKPSNDDDKPSYSELIMAYVKYFACIFKNLIFFIPCLIAIFVSELNKDIRLTPSPVYILFFILLLLITLLFLLPMLFNAIRTFDKSDILQGAGPFYLNKERTLGKYQNLNTNLRKNVELPTTVPEAEANPSEDKIDKMLSAFSIDKAQLVSLSPKANTMIKENESLNKTLSAVYNKGNNTVNSGATNSSNDPNIKAYTYTLFKDENSSYNIKTEYYNSVVSKEKFPYSYTYSLSFYIYLNTQPENTSIAYTKDTILFNYAYKPVIYYNGKSQKIIIKSRTISNRGDQLDTIYELANPKFQKWLFFVINYDNNIIDVFVDGKLVGSKENVSPYFKGDNITIGENDGIHGSIKQIYYYDKIKTPSTIELLYNLSKNNAKE